MNMTAILRIMVKGFLMSFVVLGLFAVAANAQREETKKFAFKVDKRKIKFTTPAVEVPSGKIVISGTVRGVDVSGGGDGCYTVTVTTYRFTPNGEKIRVSSRSKRICKQERLPELVIDRIPSGRFLIELEIDRPIIGEGRLEGELTMRVQSERINLR